MKKTIIILQYFIGILFIISGLVKANDPLGLAYKMEEFFQLWNTSLAKGNFFAKHALIALFNFLNEHNLLLSVFMITLEIVAGVALLAGWMKNATLSLLLALVVFFSFLTGYAYLSGKFTSCGCFGDCLPITPLTSFIKDILLLLLILALIIGRKHIFVYPGKQSRSVAVACSFAFALFIQWYALNYLPLVDCLPLKKGNNITEQIKPPKNAIPSVYETRLVYENLELNYTKEMSQEEFNNSKIWEDKRWKWKETKTKLVRQGTDVPALHNFSLTDISGNDLTESILNDSNDVILYFINPGEDSNAIDHEIINTATGKGLSAYFVTSSPAGMKEEQRFRILVCDGTLFRIAARVNPTIYLLKHGTIIDKWPLMQKHKIIETIKNINPKKLTAKD